MKLLAHFREIRRLAPEPPRHEEGSRSRAQAQEGAEERDQAARADPEGQEGSRQEGVEESDAKSEEWEVQEEEIIFFCFVFSLWLLVNERKTALAFDCSCVALVRCFIVGFHVG